MNTFHRQLKTRRKALGLRKLDLGLRLGMPRQQYQRLEAQGILGWTLWNWLPRV